MIVPLGCNAAGNWGGSHFYSSLQGVRVASDFVASNTAVVRIQGRM
jgi:hypothetical protein